MALDSAFTMPPKPRQIRIEQSGALAAMQALQDRSDEELEREQKFKAAALAILGARAAERYDADAARDYFRRAIAASRPQERMQLRRMADASLALAERRPDDLKQAVERLGQAPPSNRQLFLLRLMGFLAAAGQRAVVLEGRAASLIILLLVIVLLAVGFGHRQARSPCPSAAPAPRSPCCSASSSSPRSSASSRWSGGAGRRAPREGARRPGRLTCAGATRSRRLTRRACASASRSATTVPVRARYNVAPGDDVLAVTTDREGAPRGELLRWGLVPYWAKDPKTLGLKLINARSETMLDQRRLSRRAPLPGRRRRLLRVGEAPRRAQAAVVGHAPRPRAVRLRRPVVELAPGRGRRAAAHASRSSPRAASEQLAHVHDRMPVMLPREAEDAWLDRATEPEALHRALRPARADRHARGRRRGQRRAPRRARLPRARPAAAHSVLSVAFSMTTGEVGRSWSSTGSLPMRCATSMPRTTPPATRVVGRQPGVGRGDDEELAARGAAPDRPRSWPSRRCPSCRRGRPAAARPPCSPGRPCRCRAGRRPG